MIGPFARRWPAPLRAVHWATALLALLTVPAAYLAQALTETATDTAEALIGLHILAGLAILMLTLGRVALRLALAPPPREEAGKVLRAVEATRTVLFYVLLLALPATGILKLTLSGLDVSAFGVTLVPAGGRAPDLARGLNRAHEWLSKGFIALALLHAGAAALRFRPRRAGRR